MTRDLRSLEPLDPEAVHATRIPSTFQRDPLCCSWESVRFDGDVECFEVGDVVRDDGGVE